MNEERKYYDLGIIFSKKYNTCEMNFRKILYLILHVSIIIIFEILFYFTFIIKKEYQVFDYLIKDITHNQYYNLNETTRIALKNIIKNMTNINYINSRALYDRNNRLNTKNDLFNQSLIIIVFFSVLSITIVFLGRYKKLVKIRYLVLDIFLLLCMIGVFEYIFFTKIISHIKPISPYELLSNVIENFEEVNIDN